MSETTVFDGCIIKVTTKQVGDIAAFETVHHPGAVAVVAHDYEHVWLTRQYRPTVNEMVIELVAGTREPGEEALTTAQRELAEEIGLEAGSWNFLCGFYSSPGYTDEQILMFEAWDLQPASSGHTPDPDEQIEVIRWPLSELDQAIGMATTAKTILGLCLLERSLRT